MVEAIANIFQLTTSRRGRPDRPSVDFQIWFFQLTTSRRGRPLQLCVKRLPFCLSTHDLTQRSTLHYNILWYIFQSFNSRPHAEVDVSADFCHEAGESFNSRPHAEVDFLAICMYPLYQIFQLTTSRRGRPQKIHRNAIISIFQLTTSRRGRRNLLIPCCTSLSFQLTTSRRGRPPPGATSSQTANLSTHDLTQRSTKGYAGTGMGFCFQLTTSRRGRQRMESEKKKIHRLSTHDLTQRSTSTPPVMSVVSLSFNSRPHAEVDKTLFH